MGSEIFFLPILRIDYGLERCILQRSFCRTLRGEGHQCRGGGKSFGWKAELQPAIEAAQQGANFFISFAVEEPRHPGAGSFVGSSAIHHHGTARRDFLVPRLKFLRRDVDRSGNFRPFRLVAEIGPQIDNHHAVTAGQHFV